MTAISVVDAKLDAREIDLDLLEENPNNPRKTYDEGALEELEQSIRTSGITQPLLVRPMRIEGDEDVIGYEIVAGHRRKRAAKLAGLESVPCVIREMTDAEAADLALIDNLQRVNVGALEEAEAFGELLARHGSIEAVAAKVGKDIPYVAKLLKLRTLGIWERDALRARLITIDHALLLARLGVEEQDAALKWALDSQAGVKVPLDQVIVNRIKKRAEDKGNWHYSWEPVTVLRLKEHIEQSSGRKLSRAPWDLDDAALNPESGPCSSCPSNTKANTALFADLDIEEATCADGCCFERKREAFVQLSIKEIGAGNPEDILRLSWRETTTAPRMESDFGPTKKGSAILTETRKVKLSQLFKSGQWIEAKKGSCAHLKSGVTIDWNDDVNRGYMSRNEKLRKPGEILTVCVALGCKTHPKAWEAVQHQAGSRSDSAAEKAKAEKRQADVIAENKMRIALAGKALEGITAISSEVLRALVIDSAPGWEPDKKAAEALLPGLAKILKTASVASSEFAKAVAIISLEELTANEYHEAPMGRKEFLASIKRLGYAGATPWDKPKPAKKAAPKKAEKKPARTLKPETRKRIAAAVSKRWAKSPEKKGGGV